MATSTKTLDITKSYVPGDPNSVPVNLEYTRSGDDPKAPIPITPFEGYNFLPTAYGYRSYFGTNAILDIPIVPCRCDKILIAKATNLTVKAIALCEDGIWTKDLSTSSGSWVQEVAFILANSIPSTVTTEGSVSPPVTEETTVTFNALLATQSVTVGGHTYTATVDSSAAQVATALSGGGSPNGILTGALVNWTLNLDSPGVITYTSTTPDSDVSNLPISVDSPVATSYTPTVHRMWTDIKIANESYFYQTGRETINKMSASLVFSTVSPSFLTMSGQVGIFQAGGRIGIWDILGSVANSSVFDFSDFTPSIETLANITKFRDVLGKIVTILKHGEGFIIYATNSITSVSINTTSAGLLWQASPVSKTKGIRHAEEVSIGSTNQEHYVYTTEGLIIIKGFNSFTKSHEIEAGLTPTIDFLREDGDMVQLKVMQNRYIFFNLVNVNYINGIVHTFETTMDSVGAIEVLWSDDNSHVLFSDGSTMLFTGATSFPSVAFNLQAGIDIPIYPTFKGSLVWDIQLNKWGKFKGDFRLVTELTPTQDFDAETLGFTTFGMNVGILQNDGVIRLFDSRPTDSLCRWGKYGLSRSRNTILIEAHISFRSNSTGEVEIQSSLNNRDFNENLTLVTPFNNTRNIVHKGHYGARWHAIGLRGQWDLQNLELTGRIAGRR